jgi:transposase
VVLSYSRLLWLRFFRRQDMRTLFGGLEQAFEFFGGVPQELLFDQMRAVIVEDQRLQGGPLVENVEFVRFAHHWQFRPRACRPYRAKTKGKVERPIRYLRENFFYGRTFINDEDLDAQAQQWLQDVANVRLHGTTGEPPIERFQREEQAALTALAARPYRSLVLAPPTCQPSPHQRVVHVEVERRSLELYSRLVANRS